jgi:hypothetical protein
MRLAMSGVSAGQGRYGSLWRLGALVFVCCMVVMFGAAHNATAQPSTEHRFEILPGSFHFSVASDQAGAHADWVTSFDFAHSQASGKPYNDVRTTVVNLPAGFTGNNTAVPTCSDAQLLEIGPGEAGTNCPPASQIGTIHLDLMIAEGTQFEEDEFPVYNLQVTSVGVAAELGFRADILTQVLPITVRPDDEGLTVTSPSIVEVGEPHNITVTTWAIPGSPVHNAERGRECIGGGKGLTCTGGNEEVTGDTKPFLANPTSCGDFTATLESNSWEESGNWSKAESQVGPITECERVHFEPSIKAAPTTTAAESPTGLNFSIGIPQTWEQPGTIVTSNLKDTSVTLPEGLTANPSLAVGLGSCTPAQYESETAQSPIGAGCPPEAKIGSIEIETPLLAEKIPGAVYIATPYDNPFDSLLALYVVAKDLARGIIVKVAGKIEPNPVTGQLVTTFDNTPQQPFSHFTLKFRPGAAAPLISPAACGSYSAQAELTPWSAPLEQQLVSSTPFAIEHGVNGGACPAGGVPPFHPQVVSGTSNNAGSSYSPFYLQIVRADGEQEFTRFSTTLPPGLTGNLSGISFCPEASIEAAKNVTGAQEEASPSCPAASEIGHTIVSAGVGSVLAQTPGKVYLAGPYHGAPLSIVSITSAKVGPFDLGTVVIRFALDINPVTAQVEVSANGSDPIPHIIKGIIVHVREIRVYMDREKFILNPTSCNPMGITDTIDGAGANPANPADQVPVSVSTPFEAADCSSLQFKPGFTVTTSGKTSKANGASLTAKLTIPSTLGTQTNIREVKVDLPKQLPSRLTTLQKACTAAQFNANPAGCPAASVIGHAKAITPILPVPIEGPVYFVSHGGEAFPSLTMVLRGYGITIDLTAATFISKAGITSSTFKTVPDQPVTSFEITLPEGPYSALAANGNLCTSKLAMPTAFVAQNGATLNQETHIEVTGCPTGISVESKSINKKTLKFSVYAPGAGKITATGKGVTSETKSYSGREAQTFTLIQKQRGKLKSKIQITYTPTKGKKQSKSVSVEFKK